MMDLSILESILIGIAIMLPVACARRFIIRSKSYIYGIPYGDQKLTASSLISIALKGILLTLVSFISLLIISSTVLVLIVCTLSVIILYILNVIISFQIGYMTSNSIVIKNKQLGYLESGFFHYFFNVDGYPYKHVKCKFYRTQESSFINPNKYFMLDTAMFYPLKYSYTDRYLVFKVVKIINESMITTI